MSYLWPIKKCKVASFCLRDSDSVGHVRGPGGALLKERYDSAVTRPEFRNARSH